MPSVLRLDARAALAVVMAFACLLTACRDAQAPDFEVAEVGPVPPYAQRPGDPQAGYRALVDKAYVTCGLPQGAYLRTADPAPESHRLPGREGLNAELPYHRTAFTAKSGVELVTTNCLACHGAFFDGELVIGLGNETLDFTDDPLPAIESAGAYVRGEAATAEWRKWADRIAAIAPYMRTDTVGVNPAPNVTLALMAHRDAETLAWSDEPRLEMPPKRPLPVSVPPWWRMGKKHAMFYHTVGRGDHARLMMLKSLVCTDTVEEAREIDAYFTDIRAYIASLEPPRYPFAVDAALAEHGERVFERTCAGCHGRYGADETYPNLVVALEEVGTDPVYARQAVERWRPYAEWFERSFYGEIADAVPAPGYIAPPLDGVWATAPYLHNGSVPTLETLLASERRPRYWRRRSLESTDYDREALGWRYERLPGGKTEAAPQARKHIYDTTLLGYSNAGHTYGDPLDEAERRALLEYLKTL